MSYVEYERQGEIAIITLNRPDRMNALGVELRTEMAEAWTRFRDEDDAWVGILTGTGKAFCAGEDLKESVARGKAGGAEIPIHDPYRERELEKPTIAAINGFAVGGGFALAVRADLRIAAESATFQIGGLNRGWLGSFPIGMEEGFPMGITADILLGARISAERAYQIGLVTQVVPDDQLLPEAIALAERVASFPPLAVRETVKLMREGRPAMSPALAAKVAERNAWLGTTEDAMEARRAFVEKRKPVFRGR